VTPIRSMDWKSTEARSCRPSLFCGGLPGWCAWRSSASSSCAAPPLPSPLRLPISPTAIEGSEPQRILQDAAEDLHDTVFLELPDGVTLDLESARFVDGTDDQDARTEFHFPREVDGRPTIDPDTERIIFHCHASAKTSRPNRNGAISLRAEFKPRTMRARNLPD